MKHVAVATYPVKFCIKVVRNKCSDHPHLNHILRDFGIEFLSISQDAGSDATLPRFRSDAATWNIFSNGQPYVTPETYRTTVLPCNTFFTRQCY